MGGSPSLGGSISQGQPFGPPSTNTGPFQGRDQFGRTGPFQGRGDNGIFNPNTLYGNGAPMGSAGWVGSHPDFKQPAQGVGSADWMQTHPNYNMPPTPGGGISQGQPGQNFFTGGTPLLGGSISQGQPYGGGGNDFMSMLQRMFGGGGGY